MSCPTCNNSEGEGPGIVPRYFKGQEQYKYKCTDPWHTSAPPVPHCRECGHVEESHFSAEMGSFCKECPTENNVWEHVFQPAPPAPAAQAAAPMTAHEFGRKEWMLGSFEYPMDACQFASAYANYVTAFLRAEVARLKALLNYDGQRGDLEKVRADIAEEKVAKLQEQLAWHKQQMNEGYKVPALEEKVARLEKERDEARKELDAKTNSH